MAVETAFDVLQGAYDEPNTQLRVGVDSIPGATSIATGQVSVGTGATLVIAARAGRRSLVITNTSSKVLYFGPSGVTTSTGLLIAGTVGAAISIPTTGAVYCVVNTGTATVSYMEVY